MIRLNPSDLDCDVSHCCSSYVDRLPPNCWCSLVSVIYLYIHGFHFSSLTILNLLFLVFVTTPVTKVCLSPGLCSLTTAFEHTTLCSIVNDFTVVATTYTRMDLCLTSHVAQCTMLTQLRKHSLTSQLKHIQFADHGFFI